MTMNEEISQEENKKPRLFLWKGIGIFFALFAICVVIYLLYAVNTKFTEQNLQLSQLEKIKKNKITKLENNYVQIQKNNQQALEELTAQVAKKNTINQEEWINAEARYLIKLANDKIQFENNVPAAILLLKMADKVISEVSDTETTSLRQTLAEDIAALQSVPTVDVTGLYLQLTALGGKVNQIPLINKPTMTPTEPPKEASTSWWQRGLHHTWQGLRQVVVVRYNESGKLPLIPPDLQAYFYQNVLSVILEARWALLHGDSTIYKNSLNEAITWIKEYAVLNPNTESLVNELNELAKTDIHPTVPALSALQGSTVSER